MKENQAIREVGRVGSMPYGLARTQAAEQLARRIRTEGPAPVLPYALTTLIDSMFWAGEAEKSFVPFTELVRLWDVHPEHFDEQDRHSLFWIFKWMVAGLMEFAQVPAAQIEATIEDMARRYALEGLGTNAVMHQRFLWAAELGDPGAADAAFDAWCATPRDDFSQCEACDPGDRAAYLLTRGRHAEAARIVEAALADSPRCATEPASMLSCLQLALLALGRDDDGAKAHRRAVAELDRAIGEMSGARGRCIEFLARSGNDAAALRRIAADQHLLAGCETPRATLDFLIHVGTATHLVRGGDANLTVPLSWPVTVDAEPGTVGPATAPIGATQVTVAELDEWVHARARALAALFDARNGTDAAGRLVEGAWRTERSGRTVDLSVLRPEDLTGDPADPSAADDASTAPGVPGPSDGARCPEEEAATDPVGDLVTRAEQAEDDEEWEEAAALYLRASHLELDGGRLQEAGWSVARAARCAWRSSDPAGATTTYQRALAMLEAADTPVTELVPVLCDHAQCAAELGEPRTALSRIDAHAAALDDLRDDAPDPADDAPVDPDLAERERTQRRLARLQLTDLQARLLASAGDLPAAAALAEEAAVAFAELGSVGDAAHAFWLAGRVHRDLGDLTAAAWHLESAVEGLVMCPDRKDRADAAGELIAVLRAAGRDAEADTVEA